MYRKKRDKNGKKPQGKNMKPIQGSCVEDCQYKIVEEVVEKKRVKEKDVFDKGAVKGSKKKSK